MKRHIFADGSLPMPRMAVLATLLLLLLFLSDAICLIVESGVRTSLRVSGGSASSGVLVAAVGNCSSRNRLPACGEAMTQLYGVDVAYGNESVTKGTSNVREARPLTWYVLDDGSWIAFIPSRDVLASADVTDVAGGSHSIFYVSSRRPSW
ncbi:hypothetical protein SAMN05216446_0822 [Parafannyhessea umbonata]|uniref:Uncharacterized protein n=1 Tax=Parafannyhessea umbonata TaxID=604330 RepID=A0A1H9P5D8_9ACTN|nr:hypothetical protein SAMN05216446_0822 [Parafannyhessea umbonata]